MLRKHRHSRRRNTMLSIMENQQNSTDISEPKWLAQGMFSVRQCGKTLVSRRLAAGGRMVLNPPKNGSSKPQT